MTKRKELIIRENLAGRMGIRSATRRHWMLVIQALQNFYLLSIVLQTYPNASSAFGISVMASLHDAPRTSICKDVNRESPVHVHDIHVSSAKYLLAPRSPRSSCLPLDNIHRGPVQILPHAGYRSCLSPSISSHLIPSPFIVSKNPFPTYRVSLSVILSCRLLRFLPSRCCRFHPYWSVGSETKASSRFLVF